jgi:hypothetical protein
VQIRTVFGQVGPMVIFLIVAVVVIGAMMFLLRRYMTR